MTLRPRRSVAKNSPHLNSVTHQTQTSAHAHTPLYPHVRPCATNFGSPGVTNCTSKTSGVHSSFPGFRRGMSHQEKTVSSVSPCPSCRYPHTEVCRTNTGLVMEKPHACYPDPSLRPLAVITYGTTTAITGFETRLNRFHSI